MTAIEGTSRSINDMKKLHLQTQLVQPERVTWMRESEKRRILLIQFAESRRSSNSPWERNVR